MSNVVRFPVEKRFKSFEPARGPAKILEIDLYRHRKTPLKPTPRRRKLSVQA